MRSSHSLDRLDTAFDDDRLVPDAGLILPATLAHHLGLQGARRRAPRPGREARPGQRRRQAPDARDVGARGRRPHRRRGRPAGRRHGAGAGLHGQGRLDPGHVPAQLPLGPRAPARPGQPGAARRGPGRRARVPATDRSRSTSTRPSARPTASQKEGALHHGYTDVRGYHPLLAVAAGTGDVLMARLREGRANTGRGAGHFLRETIGRVRDAGATGQLTMRADSGFYAHAVVAMCRRLDVRFSITVRQHQGLRGAHRGDPRGRLDAHPLLDRRRCRRGRDRLHPVRGREGRASRCGSSCAGCGRRPGSQLALFTLYDYHAFITDRDGRDARARGRPPPPCRDRERHPGPTDDVRLPPGSVPRCRVLRLAGCL